MVNWNLVKEKDRWLAFVNYPFESGLIWYKWWEEEYDAFPG